MSKVPETKTGIQFLTTWYDNVGYQDFGFESAVESGSDPAEGDLNEVDMHAKLDVWAMGDPDHPEETLVRLTVMIQPLVRPSYKAQVGVIGRFAAEEDATLQLNQFSRTSGVAYLVPFIRSKLAELTTHSRYGPFLLPPLDVADLLKLIGESEERRAAAQQSPEASEPGLFAIGGG